MGTGMIFTGGIPFLIEWTFGPHHQNAGSYTTYTLTLLIGTSAGLIGGPVVNSRLHFSRLRWNLITLGGILGALGGESLAVLAGANHTAPGEWMTSQQSAMVAAGAIAGLAATAFFTGGLDPERSHPAATALIHYESGRLSMGDLTSVIVPARGGPSLRVFESRF